LEQTQYIQAGSSGIYEILLIVLVLVLIFNGLLRNKILRNYQNQPNTPQASQNQPKSKSNEKKTIEGEYIDYEIVEDN
jgi:hypothetical protein